MEFETDIQESAFHSPLEDFERVTEQVEVRTDPLTGRTARVADGAFVAPDEYDIEDVVTDDEGCFFCPGLVESATPTYPDWYEDERGNRGEATSFPNLNPYGSYSNVVALTESHFQPMEAFTTTQLADGLALGLEFVQRVRAHDDAATRASVNMNFLRSAGSSLVHPHMQTLVDDRGTNELRRLLDASQDYRADQGSQYWRDLVAEEEGGERWIGATDGVDWLAAFAPKHHRHVVGVVESAELKPEADAVGGIAEGLTNVLASYAEAGLNAFNVALHLPDDEAMGPVVNVIARSVFDEYYWSDSPFFTVLHDEGVVATAPEDYAAAAREGF
jgi:UDPglucose--hexose-1-phosphate uridylyltransferase